MYFVICSQQSKCIFFIRKRQSNAAAVGSNSEEVKTFTVPCSIDVQLDKATVC